MGATLHPLLAIARRIALFLVFGSGVTDLLYQAE
jgi:hypothetical protein